MRASLRFAKKTPYARGLSGIWRQFLPVICGFLPGFADALK